MALVFWFQPTSHSERGGEFRGAPSGNGAPKLKQLQVALSLKVKKFIYIFSFGFFFVEKFSLNGASPNFKMFCCRFLLLLIGLNFVL